MELKVKAGDLRAVDRPLQCKLALEALKSDPRVLQGKLEQAPAAVEVYGTDGTDAVGPEPGATGFARTAEAQSAASGYRLSARAVVGGRGARASVGGAHAEFSSLFGGAAGGGGLGDGGGGGEEVDDVELDSTQKHRKKKKKKKTVVVPVAAADGGEDGGGDSVEYDLPLHVQCVEGKQCSPSLRLKVRHTYCCTYHHGNVVDSENQCVGSHI